MSSDEASARISLSESLSFFPDKRITVRAKEAVTMIPASMILKRILFLGDWETEDALVNGLPHHLQNFQLPSFSFPQLGQYIGENLLSFLIFRTGLIIHDFPGIYNQEKLV